MRIYVVGPQFHDSFARNIAVTLEQMGFQVSTGVPGLAKGRQDQKLNPLLSRGGQLVPALEKRLQQGFVRAVERTKPDLVLATHGELTPWTVKQLRNVAPAVAAWYPDPTANLGREYLLGSDYHCVFFKEPRAVALFRKNLGLPAYFLPECCNPIWHHPQDCTSEEFSRLGCDVAIAGNCYYYRLRMVEELAGFDVRIWGGHAARWLEHPMLRFRQRHYVAEEEKAKAFRAAKIVLNTLTHKETDSVNCRLFEATGCGGFVLTENRPAVEDFFEAGREVATFDSRPDLLEKVRYYLAHAGEREAIAQAGGRRAHRDHTYELRLRRLLEVVSQHTGVLFPLPAKLADCLGSPTDSSLAVSPGPGLNFEAVAVDWRWARAR
jgi:spore maturation protein CgeB